MENLVRDEGFIRYMSNGATPTQTAVNDLHPDIAHIVYAAYSSNVIRTTYSWAGTIGRRVDPRTSVDPKKVTYEEGTFCFQTLSFEGERVADAVLALVKRTPFARFSFEPRLEQYVLDLDMDDLIAPDAAQRPRQAPITELFDDSMAYIRAERKATNHLVDFRAASARYGEFLHTWDKVYKIILPFVVRNKRNLRLIEADAKTNAVPNPDGTYPRQNFSLKYGLLAPTPN